MCEWVTSKLGNLCTKIGSGATPRGGKEVYKENGISLIRSQNVYNNRFTKEGLAFIDDEQAAGLSNVEVETNDVLLNITGDSVARACQVPDSVLPARVNQHVAIVRPDQERLDPGYLRYWLVSPRTQGVMLGLASAGATRKALTKSMIEEFQIPLPKIGTQQRIAYILGTLDDKIELNRRMNRTLEAITRAIFKSWFIDFDPVHAKAEGREPVGMDPETAALFPDSFQDSPLGQIPKGWKVGNLDSLLALSRDSIKPLEFPKEQFDHFSIPAFDVGEPSRDFGETIRSSKYMVPSSAALISKLNPHLPRVWLPHVSDVRRAICSTEFLVCMPKSGMPREYVYNLLLSRTFLDRFAQLVTGTTGSHQRVHPATFLKMNTVLPTQDLCGVFARSVRPMLRECAALLIESRELAETREALLPELITGRFA